MRTLKFLALCGLLAGAAELFFGPVEAQTGQPMAQQSPQPVSVADIKAMAEAVQALQNQQKTIAANQAAIDGKLAAIAENVRLARLMQSRSK